MASLVTLLRYRIYIQNMQEAYPYHYTSGILRRYFALSASIKIR